MPKSRKQSKGTVSPIVAVASIFTSVLVVILLGFFIGYKFFWNAYDKDNISQHDVKVAQERVKLDPNNVNNLVSLGRAFNSLGKQDEALAQFQKALKLDPKNLVVRYNISLIKLQEKDYAGARIDLEAIKSDNPKYWEARATLGFLLLDLNEAKLAAQELETVNSFEPGNTDILYKLAQAYDKMGDRARAKATLELAIKYNPLDQQLQKALTNLQ